MPQDYADILQILPRLPEPDMAAAQAALAGLADIAPEQRAQRAWLARWQGRAAPRLNHPRLSIFAANHGCAALDAASESIAAQLPKLLAADGAISQAAAECDADVRFYDMHLASATRDFRTAAAMEQSECLHAITYGMMAVEPGLDALALASCGDGQRVAAAVLVAAATGQGLLEVLQMLRLPAAWAESCTPVVARLAGLSPCAVLEAAGGREIAALLGALLAARMAHTPVIIADHGGLAALALLQALDPLAGRHVALAGALTSLTWWPQLLRLPTSAETGVGLSGLHTIAQLQAVV